MFRPLQNCQDAETFASWGVDALKVDGCNSNASYYSTGYPLMGASLEATGRNVLYACSCTLLGRPPPATTYNETCTSLHDLAGPDYVEGPSRNLSSVPWASEKE